MNSEELELSLRTDFESYLKSVFADVRQEVSDFQSKFQTEFEKHKSQLDDVFQDFSARIENEKEIDGAFRESVIEHLRLARDEGARITASAIAEAEEMQKDSVSTPAASFSEIRDAIIDISAKDSQSAILKSLVHHAAQFTPRGAFFIIKNEHFVGWRVFGKEGNADEQSVREVFFPISADTVLGDSVRSLSAVESGYGTHSDDSIYLNKLDFGQPDRMYAIPLVARGRGVAVLYADYGTEGVNVNVEALETIVRVAGLTVELLAASGGKVQKDAPQDAPESTYESEKSFEPETETAEPASQFENSQSFHAPVAYGFEQTGTVENYDSVPVEENYVSEPESVEEASEPEAAANDYEYEVVSNDFAPTYGEFTEPEAESAEEEKSDFVPAAETEVEEEPVATEEVEQIYSWSQPIDSSDNFATAAEETEKSVSEPESFEETVETEQTDVETVETAYSNTDFAVTPTADFDSSQSFETPETTQFESPQYRQWESGSYEEPKFETANGFEAQNGKSESFVAEPVETVSEVAATQPVKSRLSERNVDLPIEVADDERRLHNDARRFARLLVSEIKLYNEQKVKEGRESSDLYDRLREAIDRSREMYDKRVQPPVAAKFDYFHYELVSNLAEGNEGKLGTSYPGANV